MLGQMQLALETKEKEISILKEQLRDKGIKLPQVQVVNAIQHEQVQSMKERLAQWEEYAEHKENEIVKEKTGRGLLSRGLGPSQSRCSSFRASSVAKSRRSARGRHRERSVAL